MTKFLLLLSLLAACEQAESTPAPTIPEPPPPPPPADAGPEPVDAPPPAVVADINCYVNGPKEILEIATDPVTNKGLLHRMTTGPVPDRYIKFTLRPDGPSAFDLVFDGYEKPDYRRMWNAKPTTPREKLEKGKSVVARLWVEDGKSYLRGEAVDLHTGMSVQRPDHAYVCDPREPGRPSRKIYVPR